MGRVEIASLSLGLVSDTAGNVEPDETITIANSAGAAAVVYAAATGTSTVAPVSDGSGYVAGYLEEGVYTFTIGSRSHRMDVVSGQPGGTYYVKAYGAIGNGTTNDTVAIQAALDAVPPGGGVVYFPPGTYLFSTLSRTLDNLTLVGDQATLLTSMSNNGTSNAVTLVGNNLIVRGLTFRQQNPVLPFNLSSRSNGELLRIGGTTSGPTWVDRVLVEGCKFDSAFTVPLNLYYANKATARGNTAVNCGGGLTSTSCQEAVIFDGNFVKTCGDDMIVNLSDANVPAGTLRFTAVNNICDTGDAKGIATTGADKVVIANNHIRNTYTFGVAIFQDVGLSPSHRPVIEGNTLERCGYKFGSTPTNLHSSVSTVPNGIFIGPGVQSARVSNNLIIDTQGIAISADWQTVSTTSTGTNTLPTGTVNVTSTASFASAGIATIIAADGTSTTFSYTGKTATTLTGCTGGLGAFAAASTVINCTVGLDISDNNIQLAGSFGMFVGNPDGADFVRMLDTQITGNDVKQTHGGIYVGGGTGFVVSGNTIRSYKQGDAGSKRGIYYGAARNMVIAQNVIFNDDTGNETIVAVGTNQNVRKWGNIEMAPATADQGSFFVVDGLRTTEGSNGKQGTAVLVAGAKVVNNTSVTATSRIFLTSNADGGAPGFLRVSARTAGTSFTITSSSGTDTSTVAYEIFEVG